MEWGVFPQDASYFSRCISTTHLCSIYKGFCLDLFLRIFSTYQPQGNLRYRWQPHPSTSRRMNTYYTMSWISGSVSPSSDVTPSSSFPTRLVLPRRQKGDLCISERSWLSHGWMDKVLYICHVMLWLSMYIKKGASPLQHLHWKQTLWQWGWATNPEDVWRYCHDIFSTGGFLTFPRYSEQYGTSYKQSGNTDKMEGWGD